MPKLHYSAESGAWHDHDSPFTVFADCPAQYKGDLEFLASNNSPLNTTVPLQTS
jgi:hypothetical protein